MISLRLPSPVEKRLNAAAKKSGKTRTEIVLRSIEEFLARGDIDQTAYELGEDLFDSLPPGPVDLAHHRKKNLRENLKKKNEERHSR